MTEIVSLEELAAKVPSGSRIGIGGVHLSRLPLALIGRVLELGRRDFTYISWGGGLPLEMFLEAGAIKKLIFCFSSMDFFGLAPRFRRALEKNTVEVEEWTALAMIQGLHAAYYNIPDMPFQLPAGSDLMDHGDFWKKTVSPFTGEPVGLVQRLDVDVLLIHAQRADSQGNVEIQGARGLDISLLGAAKSKLFTVEEIVEVGKLGDAPKSFVLPREFVTGLAKVPRGAYPTSCLPYYSTDYRRLLQRVREESEKKKATAAPGQAPETPAQEPKASSFEFKAQEKRIEFLQRTANTRVSSLSPSRLSRFGLKIAPDAPCTLDEFLAATLAREYDNSSICSVGSVSPLAIVSYLLAQRRIRRRRLSSHVTEPRRTA